MSAVRMFKSGRSPSSAGLSARQVELASSRTAMADTDSPSRLARVSRRCTTSSGTFRKYNVLMLQYASILRRICKSPGMVLVSIVKSVPTAAFNSSASPSRLLCAMAALPVSVVKWGKRARVALTGLTIERGLSMGWLTSTSNGTFGGSDEGRSREWCEPDGSGHGDRC